MLSVRWALGGLEGLLSVSNLSDVFVAAAFVWAARRFLCWHARKYYEPRQRELESLLESLQSN